MNVCNMNEIHITFVASWDSKSSIRYTPLDGSRSSIYFFCFNEYLLFYRGIFRRSVSLTNARQVRDFSEFINLMFFFHFAYYGKTNDVWLVEKKQSKAMENDTI